MNRKTPRLLKLSHAQLAQIRAATTPLAPEARPGFVKVVAALLELQGETNDAAFDRALRFARETQPTNTEVAPR
jgi:hypothetical protein